MHEFFKILSDETRLRCLALIVKHQELCVCEIIHALDLPQSKISRHLALIKSQQLIQDRREGQWVFYSLHDNLATTKVNILNLAIEELNHSEPYQGDNKRLISMENRPFNRCCESNV
ncbi:MAG: ArsR/SmtB family transcription factor [bacterium]